VEAEQPEEEMAEEGAISDVYRIGIFEDPISLNYWNYLGPGSSVWTQYVLNDTAGSLYNLSDQRFDFVPSLATDLPPEPVQEGDFWTVTVPMKPDAIWNDGTPLTAHDVAFTVNTCLELKLTSGWPSQCRPEITDHVEAVDDNTVKVYFNEKPGLPQWQYGVAQAPILPEHYWGDKVAESYAFIEGLEEPVAPEGVEDCTAEELSAEDAATCEPYLAEQAAYDEAFTNARTLLYGADATGAPSAGGFTTDVWEEGAFVQRTANPNYLFKGAEIVETDDGAWTMTTADGQTIQLYGDGSGEELLRFTQGPNVENVIFTLYGDQSAAFLALAAGEVDYTLNPLSLARGLREQAEQGEGIQTYTNPDNGLFYLAFNMRREPFGDPAFQEAVDWLIDKEFVAESVLQGSIIPAYSVVPPGNSFWYNEEIETPTIGLSRAERLNNAIAVLEEAGYTWDQKPEWDPEDPTAEDLVNGEGLRGPDGELIEPFVILGPGPAYDPQRASFNQWISEWMRELGMPVESELTGFNTILGPVFTDATFDMYILGWSLTIYPDHVCDFFHSRNDTIVSGGYNTPGFNDPEFDALCDEFAAETDITKAQAQNKELQQALAEGRPYIPLFYRQSIDLISDNVELPYTETLGGLAELLGFQGDATVRTSR
jgi:peptide/nickel transport system substrate-binding protein